LAEYAYYLGQWEQYVDQTKDPAVTVSKNIASFISSQGFSPVDGNLVNYFCTVEAEWEWANSAQQLQAMYVEL